MKILVVGDSFCPVGVFGARSSAWRPSTRSRPSTSWTSPAGSPGRPSEQRIREYLGSPAQVIERLAGHDVLVVQGAPVTDAVLDAAPSLRLVCVARGGPVNVDVAAATERGHPGRDHAGQERPGRGRADLRLHHHARPPDAGDHRDTSRAAASSPATTTRARSGSATTSRAGVLGVVGFGQVGPPRGGPRRRVRDARPGPRSLRAGGGDRAIGRRAVRLARRPAGVGRRGVAPRPRHARRTGAHRARAVRAHEARRALRQHRPATPSWTRTRCTTRWPTVAWRAPALDVVQPPDLAIPPELGRRHRLLDHPNVVLAPHIGGATYETLAPRRRDGRRGDRAPRRGDAAASTSRTARRAGRVPRGAAR